MEDNKFYTNIDVRGNIVNLRYVENGEHLFKTITVKPELYIKTNDASKADAVSMHNEPLEKVTFEDKREMNSFLESYKDIDGFSVYGSDNIMNQFVSKMYPGTLKHNASLIKGAIFDIETFSGDIEVQEDGTIKVIEGPFPDPETADYPISMLTCHCSTTDTYYTWGLETFKGVKIGTYVHDPLDPRVGHLNIVYRGFDDERDMLNNMCDWWAEYAPNYYSGWNVEGFDNPYLTNRVARVCGDGAKNKLSPWGYVKKNTIKNAWGQESTVYDYTGCQMLDYKQLFEKHAYANPDDMKLGTVAEYVLGETKIDHSDEGSINSLYIVNYQKSVVYNIIDVNLIVRMNAKKRFFELTFTLAYICKSNYGDTLGTVKPWSALTYSMLYDKGQRPKLKAAYQGDTSFGGGFVRAVKPGRRRWVVSGDLNSLYPHLIQQFNLGAETIVEPEDLPAELRNLPSFTLDDLVNKKVDLSALKKYDLCMTANRQFFKRGKKSIFNEKTRQIYDDRKVIKKEMLGFEQQLVLARAEAKKRGLI